MLPPAAFVVPADRTSRLARMHPASKVIGLLLAILTCWILPSWLIPAVLGILIWSLWRRGLSLAMLARAGRPWLPVALFVIAVHTLTTIESAPLGRPSWAGLMKGMLAIARVASLACCLALFLRITPLSDLIAGIGWWCRPLQRFGFDTRRLSLVLTVAIGTVPGVLAEGRRIDAVVRLRRAGLAAQGGKLTGWWRRALDRGYLVVPLLESLFRKAESLTLALRGRLPQVEPRIARPPVWHLAGFGVWLVLLSWQVAL